MAKCDVCGHLAVVQSIIDDHRCWEHDIDCGDDD